MTLNEFLKDIEQQVRRPHVSPYLNRPLRTYEEALKAITETGVKK